MKIKKTRYKTYNRKRAGRVASSMLSFVLVFVLVVAMLPIVSPAAYAQEEAVPVSESDASKQEAPTQEPSEETEQPTDKEPSQATDLQEEAQADKPEDSISSGEVSTEADTDIPEADKTLRNPPGISARVGGPVGIQPSENGFYVRNQTKIGFAGKEWWIIGDSDASTPASLQAPRADAVTLFSDQSAGYGKSKFNSASPSGIGDNDYNGSALQQAMISAYGNIPTSEEKSYVIPRDTMDLQSYPIEDAFTYANPTDQYFWPLSCREYEDIGAFTDPSSNKIRKQDSDFIRLRSPSTQSNPTTLGVASGGGFAYTYVAQPRTVRPALYFDLSDVLFTSAASGTSGMKVEASAGVKTMVPAVTPDADETVKLTREDDKSKTYPVGSGGTRSGRLGMTVDASLTTITAHPDDDVTFSYSGAQTGAGRSVSVMICNKDDAAVEPGKILFYGRPVDLTTTNSSGTATFKIPAKSDLQVGDYTLKIFNEEVNGENHTDYASTPREVRLRVREVVVSASASPDDSPVYYTDTTPGHVELTATVKNHLNINGTKIQDAQWVRVPISDTADYSATDSFDTAYASAASADKGMLSAGSNDDFTADFPLQVDKNAIYWFKGRVLDPQTSLIYTDVSSITVDNFYKEITCTVSGMNDGVNPSSVLYEDEIIPGQYGIPYDLDGTTPLATAPSLGFNTITLSAKPQYFPYCPSGTVKTKSGYPLTQAGNAKAVTLDGTVNTECDTGDFTKYTITYTIKRYIVTRDSDKNLLGSHDQLANAVNLCTNNVPCTITATADDSAMGNTVYIQSGKDITFTSIEPGSPRTITQTKDGRHFEMSGGKLTLKDITLAGEGFTTSSMAMNGGVRQRATSSLTMEAGATITRCWGNANNPGALHQTSGTFTMNGGAITHNRTAGQGGGIFADNTSVVALNGGSIAYNEAATNGGGIYVIRNADVTISAEASIDHNTAKTGGGGLYISVNTSASPPVTMNGGSISNNTTTNGTGGGVFLSAVSRFNMTGGSIDENTAKIDGGGIFTADNSYSDPANTIKYSNIHITGSAKVEENTAMSGTEVPPGNAAAFNSRFPGTLLNNDNINYRGPKVNVTISKAVRGDYGDRNKAFEFTITVQDTNGTPLASGKTLTYTGGTISSGATAPENGTLTLNSAGSATFTLKHGQSITVSGIPSSGKVQVAETVDSSYDTMYWIDSTLFQTGTDTSVISMNGINRTVDFLNDGKSVVATGLPGRTAQKGILSTGAVLCLAGVGYTIIRKVRHKRYE